jgi:hypothetical protein
MTRVTISGIAAAADAMPRAAKNVFLFKISLLWGEVAE